MNATEIENNYELVYKPDFSEARERWNHYWANEIMGRPPVLASVKKNPTNRINPAMFRYHLPLTGQFDLLLSHIDEWLDNTLFLGELVPSFGPNLGPDQWAAFMGAEFKFNENAPQTNWVESVVKERWEEFLPLVLDENNKYWKMAQDYARILARHGKGRYIVETLDNHSNADCLSALRNPGMLCMDFYDCPDLIERAMTDIKKLFDFVYRRIYECGNMSNKTGTSCWIPFWCEKKYTVLECDFLCLVGPEIARKYILPAIEFEASSLDHCVFHLDGPGALVHLDDILSIKNIDVIQWVPGAGQPLMFTWTEVLKKCQKAGKGLDIYDVKLDDIKKLSKELKPQGIVYQLSADSEDEFDETVKWLERNT